VSQGPGDTGIRPGETGGADRSSLDPVAGIHSPVLDALLSDLSRSEEAGPDLHPSGSSVRSKPAELRTISIESIRPNEYQPRRRFEESALSELAESIRELGVLQPILVRPLAHGGYELVAGERRWRAARRVGLADIPAIIRTTSDLESLEEAIVENLHRADLNAIEEANAYRQLVDDFALTQDEVARRVGRSRSAVANTLRLLQLPGSVQRLIMAGRLSAGHARAVLAVSDPVRQRELAEYMVDARLSVRQAEELVKSNSQASDSPAATAAPSSPPLTTKSAAVLEVQKRLSDLLDTKVVVTESSKNGKITIDFADRTDLDRIFSLIHPLDDSH
jgi:ParB family chromosome partitioning protein